MATEQTKIVYWILLQHDPWRLYLAATKIGLCYVGSQEAPFEELEIWVKKHIAQSELVENEVAMKPYEVELVEYLEGKRQVFEMPLDLHGTTFQKQVWAELLRVPFAQTTSYTEIAERIDRPDAVRAVGTAIGANPVLIPVPCHRVFGKHGECRGYRGGVEMKGKLLELEK